MKGIVNCLFFFHIAFVDALRPRYAEAVRNALKKYMPPEFSVIVDGVQTGTYAFTDPDRRHSYVDFERFANAPNSLVNTVHHEIDHLKNRDHNEIPGDIMSYKLTTDSLGNVIEDSYVWV